MNDDLKVTTRPVPPESGRFRWLLLGGIAMAIGLVTFLAQYFGVTVLNPQIELTWKDPIDSVATFSVELRNYALTEVIITAAESDCACTMTGDLPQTIRPFETATIQFQTSMPENGRVVYDIRFHSMPPQDNLSCRVTLTGDTARTDIISRESHATSTR